jgi:dTDP-4-dehydrorhamnose 3,5-epimerase
VSWENPGGIPGVVHDQLTSIADERGSFTELWRGSGVAWGEIIFRQANLSRSTADVLRGMHFHDRQTDLWITVDGRAAVALVDLRPLIAGSADPPRTEQFDMGPGSTVLIPPRVAHGFLAIEPLELIYLVSEEYDGTDEHGFAWDDPRAALRWPVELPIVSGRDASNPALADAVSAARQRAASPDR